MPIRVILLSFLSLISFSGYAQILPEVGAWAGASNYFGDLNNATSFKKIRPAGGAFFRLNFGQRFAAKFMASYGSIAFADSLSPYEFNKQRNLSFQSMILEAGIHGEFNFFNYSRNPLPNLNEKSYTPYIMGGFNIFYFNPKTYYQGKLVELRPLGTEGQQDPEYSGIKPYREVSYAITVGGGIKINLSQNWTIGVEIANRKTFTDYLDDVGAYYVSPISLPDGTRGMAYQLMDRSLEIGNAVYEPGRQRNTSNKRDDYLMGGIFISYTFVKQECPAYR